MHALAAPVLAGVALLAAAQWLADQGVAYPFVCTAATVLSALSLRWCTARAMRVALGVGLASTLGAAGIAARAEWRLARYAAAPSSTGRAEAKEQSARLDRAVKTELGLLQGVADAASTITDSPVAAISQLGRLIGDREHRAALLLHGDSLVAWNGTLHADPARLRDARGVVASPFGLTLYASSRRGTTRAIAASLIYAATPADRLSRGLAQRLPGDEITEGFDFGPPTDSVDAQSLRFMDQGRPLFTARPVIPSVGEVRFRLLERARVRVGLALLLAFVAFLVASADRRARGAVLLIAGAVTARFLAVVPLSEFSTRSRLFDAALYYLPYGHAFSANAGALAVTSATALLFVLLIRRRSAARVPMAASLLLTGAIVLASPYLLRALATGITTPATGTSGALWLIWVVPIGLAGTALLALASWTGARGARTVPHVALVVGPVVAAAGALAAPVLWQAPGSWPRWYVLVWGAASMAVVLARPSRRHLLATAIVASLGAVTVVWGATSRGRVELAERDVRGLSSPDRYAEELGTRLMSDASGDALPVTAQGLLDRYVRSDLASSGYPMALVSWIGGRPVATFGSAPFAVRYDTLAQLAAETEADGRSRNVIVRAGPLSERLLTVRMDGGTLALALAPRTRLIGPDTYARWLGIGGAESAEPPYTMQVTPLPLEPTQTLRWRREGSELHGDWPVPTDAGAARAHVEVDLRTLDSLIPRGGLLVLAVVAMVLVVWVLAALADGRLVRFVRLRRQRVRSYRVRLSVALFLFFLIPAGTFAVWSWQQLSDDAQASRRLLVSETIRAFAGDPLRPSTLSTESARLDTKLLLYQSGVLVDASDSLFASLAPMGTLLRPDVAMELDGASEFSATKAEPVAGATGMLGYRVLPSAAGAFVLAAPARVDDLLLDRRRRDLGVLVAFALALGAAAALWLSALAARQLAQPIGALRLAARSVARGERVLSLDANATSEFVPVFSAFRAMAHDLSASRTALIDAQRRTDAVLRTVASGVVAVDADGRIILSNPPAEEMMNALPEPGSRVSSLAAGDTGARVMEFLAAERASEAFDVERDGRTIRAQLTRLEHGGAVLALDDVTELARAQRVLAWGEMARQVAHEIKNPLTPIRLGVQHLRRARGRPDFDTVLDTNVSRILDEIDRLDEIARAFSQYGSAPEERPRAEPTDIGAIVQDVIALEQLGEGRVTWSCVAPAPLPRALARADELREVLLNVFENSRLAGARVVQAAVEHAPDDADRFVEIRITDDGEGIAADVLPRLFEPRFSTRTSGSGLGLAISRRLVEGWGGEMTLESAPGAGTTARVRLLIA